MSLRLLELEVPDAELDSLVEAIEEKPVHHLWTAAPHDGLTMLSVLIDAEAVEQVTDLLADRLGHRDECRMRLLPVEATIPRIEEPDEQTEPDTPADASQREAEGEQQKQAALRISREELHEDLASGTRLTPAFAVMVALSTVVAAVGLVRGDVAIIIGAMVIAPLLGPNIALSFAATLGDTSLAARAAKTLLAGYAIAAAISLLLGLIMQVDPSASEIAARTSVTFGTIALALAAGAAGSLAFTTGVPAVLVGVMVAVALLLLTTAGLLAGSGEWWAAGRAALLLLTNVASINLAAMATFLVQRIRPRTWWEAERAKTARRVAIAAWTATLLVLAAIIAFGSVRPI